VVRYHDVIHVYCLYGVGNQMLYLELGLWNHYMSGRRDSQRLCIGTVGEGEGGTSGVKWGTLKERAREPQQWKS
jgi:hypothetical protein